MADIFREVDEDLRRDRAADAWKRVAPFVYGAVVLVVLATAVVVGWREWSQRKAMEASQRFEQAVGVLSAEAVAPDRREDALTDLAALAEDGPEGYRLLATLRLAAAEAEAGRQAEAAVLYRRLADASATPDAYRPLATLLYAMVGLAEEPTGELKSRLEPLAEQTNPWRFSAAELLALVALRDGDVPTARSHLERLAGDPLAPPTLQRRAGEILTLL